MEVWEATAGADLKEEKASFQANAIQMTTLSLSLALYSKHNFSPGFIKPSPDTEHLILAHE